MSELLSNQDSHLIAKEASRHLPDVASTPPQEEGIGFERPLQPRICGTCPPERGGEFRSFAASPLYALLLLSAFFVPVQILCSLGPNPSSYNAYLDQRPTGDAMELAGKVNAALVPVCRPNCPGLAMFRNSTAPNAMLISDAGRTKILYKPEFFTAVYDTYGDGGIAAILAHEVGHAMDAAAPASWMKSSWTPELRADAWAGCAFARMNLSASALRAGLTTLSKYPSPSHPAWTVRLPVLRAGYTQCGGEVGSFDNANR